MNGKFWQERLDSKVMSSLQIYWSHILKRSLVLAKIKAMLPGVFVWLFHFNLSNGIFLEYLWKIWLNYLENLKFNVFNFFKLWKASWMSVSQGDSLETKREISKSTRKMESGFKQNLLDGPCRNAITPKWNYFSQEIKS